MRRGQVAEVSFVHCSSAGARVPAAQHCGSSVRSFVLPELVLRDAAGTLFQFLRKLAVTSLYDHRVVSFCTEATRSRPRWAQVAYVPRFGGARGRRLLTFLDSGVHGNRLPAAVITTELV